MDKGLELKFSAPGSCREFFSLSLTFHYVTMHTLGIEPKALHTLSPHSTAQLHP